MGYKDKLYKVLSTKTFKQKLNLIRANIQFERKEVFINNYPVKLTIDPCNFCNLRCELCPVGTKAPGRQQSMMSFDLFKKIMDECGKYLWEIDLFNWGEPLLNKQIFKMIEYARKMKIDVNLSTNLKYFNDGICDNLIQSGLTKLIISLDGASQASVERYQKGNDFDAVLRNMSQIVDRRKKVKSRFPFIQWRFLVNRYNETEIEKAGKYAEELMIDRLELSVFRCDTHKELISDSEARYSMVQPWLPSDETLSMYDYSYRRNKILKDVCRLLWFESVIQPDGSVSPCCAVWYYKFDFGTICDSSFREIWNSNNYMNARKISLGGTIGSKKHICYICKRNDSQI